MERELISGYERVVEELLGKLSRDNHALAVQIASLPEEIRGFGHIKAKNVADARKRQEQLLAQFRSSQAIARAA